MAGDQSHQQSAVTVSCLHCSIIIVYRDRDCYESCGARYDDKIYSEQLSLRMGTFTPARKCHRCKEEKSLIMHNAMMTNDRTTPERKKQPKQEELETIIQVDENA